MTSEDTGSIGTFPIHMVNSIAEKNAAAEKARAEFREKSHKNPGDAFYEHDRLKHHFPYYGTVLCPIADRDYLLFSVNDDVVAWNFFWLGKYEKPLLEKWHEITIGGGVALDVGAYSGIYSLVAAKNNCQVHAFEIMQRTVERAKINFRLNDVADRISLHAYGLSSQAGHIDLHLPRNADFLGTGNSIDLKKNVPLVTKIVAEVKTINDFVEETKIDRIDAIKIDVEGHEIELLTTMRPLLEKYKPPMIIEFSKDQKVGFAMLNEIGYRLEQLHGLNYFASV